MLELLKLPWEEERTCTKNNTKVPFLTGTSTGKVDTHPKGTHPVHTPIRLSATVVSSTRLTTCRLSPRGVSSAGLRTSWLPSPCWLASSPKSNMSIIQVKEDYGICCFGRTTARVLIMVLEIPNGCVV